MPGDDLRGVVSLDLNKSIRIRSLGVEVFGTANVGWELPVKKKVHFVGYLCVCKSFVVHKCYHM